VEDVSVRGGVEPKTNLEWVMTSVTAMDAVARRSPATRAFFGLAAVSLLASLITLSAMVFIVEGGSANMIAIGSVLLAVVVTLLGYAMVIGPMAHDYESRLMESLATDPGALRDFATGLANRRGVTVRMLEAMAQADRYAEPLSAMLVRVDGYDQVVRANPAAGERVLREVGAVFTDALRMPDRPGRFGERDYLVVLPKTMARDAGMIGERIASGISAVRHDHQGRVQALSARIAVTQFRRGEDLDQFLSRLESDMKRAPSATPGIAAAVSV